MGGRDKTRRDRFIKINDNDWRVIKEMIITRGQKKKNSLRQFYLYAYYRYIIYYTYDLRMIRSYNIIQYPEKIFYAYGIRRTHGSPIIL